jgi:hypothetical protein
MKKEMTRKLGVVLLGVLFISMFLVNVGMVVAQDPNLGLEDEGGFSTAVGDVISDIWESFRNNEWSPYKDWIEGDIGVAFAKVLLALLMVFLVYAILKEIPFFKDYTGGWIGWVIAGIISFLATGYLSLSEVYLIMTSYSALGFVLSVAIPFAILIFFSISIAKEGGAGARVFAKVVWFIFLLFMFYKVIAGFLFEGISFTETGIYVLGFIAVIVYLIKVEKLLVNQLFEAELDTIGMSHKDRLRVELNRLWKEENRLVKDGTPAARREADRVRSQIKNLRAAIKKT